MIKLSWGLAGAIVLIIGAGVQEVAGQAAPQPPAGVPAPPAPAAPVSPVQSDVLPADYRIGAEDVIGVLFWKEPEMSGDVAVRPDGLIALPLLGDVKAAGLTPGELKAAIELVAARFMTEPNVTILIKQINSLKVFITGEVTNPGAYPLTSRRTVMQLIALAGGLKEYADSKHVTVMRMEGGRQRSYKFNYKDVAKGKALAQNIELKPGDTVVVP